MVIGQSSRDDAPSDGGLGRPFWVLGDWRREREPEQARARLDRRVLHRPAGGSGTGEPGCAGSRLSAHMVRTGARRPSAAVRVPPPPGGPSCPSSGLCVAVDNRGNLVTSSNPTGGAAAWTVTDVDGSNGLDGVSCPSSGLCVAVDQSGDVVTGAISDSLEVARSSAACASSSSSSAIASPTSQVRVSIRAFRPSGLPLVGFGTANTSRRPSASTAPASMSTPSPTQSPDEPEL